MLGLSLIDAAALAFFVAMWVGYHRVVERGFAGRHSLASLMNAQRLAWMEQMSRREVRIPDTAIMASLQNGTAFFASTSLLALGGTMALLRGSDDMIRVFADLPLGLTASRPLFEVKVLGLCAILGYAFFKFAWAYRLFNYTAILIGSTPPASSPHVEERRAATRRAAGMAIEAGRNFNRGQRALFFAFGYLGWFAGPYALIVTTIMIVIAIFRRQYHSDALAIFPKEGPPRA